MQHVESYSVAILSVRTADIRQQPSAIISCLLASSWSSSE